MTWRVAIIGGGPGGLMTAYQLQQRCQAPVAITIYEASSRLGGKVLSKHFQSAPIPYEAGAAELYDYSQVGDDPLRTLVDALGLSVRPMRGGSVIMNDQVLHDIEDTGTIFGDQTLLALREFDERAKEWMNPHEFYESDWKLVDGDPMMSANFQTILSGVPDQAARRYLRTLVHSDLATEAHRTNAAYGLQNYLMNNPAYMRLYSIDGGVERLPQELAARISAEKRLKEPVVRVERAADNLLRVVSRRGAELVASDYHFVVVALPHDCLMSVDWGGDLLADAMQRHHAHYDHPAHYLRISMLFERPFWRHHVHESYFMLDAFGGCCLYDESSRNGHSEYGVLGWLLAGEAAVTLGNHTDDEVVPMTLAALPSFLRHGCDLFVEGRVHRWIGAVNGLPGGVPAHDPEQRHNPEPNEHWNLFVVGDYLFDATLNGVLDSADFVAEWLVEEMEGDIGIYAWNNKPGETR